MSDYVVLKLCTGEELLGELLNDTTEGISVLNPVEVRSIPQWNKGELQEHVVSKLYCKFTDDHRFTFNNKDVVYCKDLTPSTIKYYKKLVFAFLSSRSEVDEAYEEPDELDNEELAKFQEFIKNNRIKIH